MRRQCIRDRSSEAKRPTLPIVVEMAEFVGEALHLIRLQAVRVEDDVVRDRSDRALTDALRNQIEVVAETTTMHLVEAFRNR